MKMRKLFISQPMNGKTGDEIIATREKAKVTAERRLGESVEVIDPFFKGAPANTKPLWCLGESLKPMSEADVVFFAKGWREYRDCKIGRACAIEYDIETVIEENWR